MVKPIILCNGDMMTPQRFWRYIVVFSKDQAEEYTGTGLWAISKGAERFMSDEEKKYLI